MNRTLNYIGSKHRLLPFIEEVIRGTIKGDLKDKSFADLFAGSGVVARHFKPMVREIHANDLEVFSYVLLRNYLCNESMDTEGLIERLNAVIPVRTDFFYKNYSPGAGSDRMYFTPDNALRIDSYRMAIDEWVMNGSINNHEYYFLLASLLESVDKVANTASVYAAYLKNFKATALEPLVVLPATYEITDTTTYVDRMQANYLIHSINGDILYLDPPYNGRQYGYYYHILNTLISYNSPNIKGVAGVPFGYNRSTYCQSRHAPQALSDLLSRAQFKYIFMSYNNEGIIAYESIKTIMERFGTYQCVSVENQRFKQDAQRVAHADKTIESIHILKKEL